MVVLVPIAAWAFFYVAERTTSLVRRSRIDKRRAKAEYPITGNDPVGRLIV
jgi:hypothetical protein